MQAERRQYGYYSNRTPEPERRLSFSHPVSSNSSLSTNPRYGPSQATPQNHLNNSRGLLAPVHHYSVTDTINAYYTSYYDEHRSYETNPYRYTPLFTQNHIRQNNTLATANMISRRTVHWNSSPEQRILFDSGTDFAVLSHCFTSIHTYPDTNIALTSGIRNDGSPFYASLCDEEIVVQDLTGNSYLLRYYYAIDHCDKPLQETLLQPLQIRNSGKTSNEKHLHEESDEPSQSLVIGDTTLFLLSNGVHVYLLGRKPTQYYREHMLVLEVTNPNNWQPD